MTAQSEMQQPIRLTKNRPEGLIGSILITDADQDESTAYPTRDRNRGGLDIIDLSDSSALDIEDGKTLCRGRTSDIQVSTIDSKPHAWAAGSTTRIRVRRRFTHQANHIAPNRNYHRIPDLQGSRAAIEKVAPDTCPAIGVDFSTP